MNKPKTLNAIVVPHVELAAMLVCEKHNPALFDAGGTEQAFWFIDEPSVRTSLNKINNNQLAVDPEQYKTQLKYLEDFIVESIEDNARCDAENTAKKV